VARRAAGAQEGLAAALALFSFLAGLGQLYKRRGGGDVWDLGGVGAAVGRRGGGRGSCGAARLEK
jgi:hypothetical protein